MITIYFFLKKIEQKPQIHIGNFPEAIMILLFFLIFNEFVYPIKVH